jgi:hypothetical protein
MTGRAFDPPGRETDWNFDTTTIGIGSDPVVHEFAKNQSRLPDKNPAHLPSDLEPGPDWLRSAWLAVAGRTSAGMADQVYLVTLKPPGDAMALSPSTFLAPCSDQTWCVTVSSSLCHETPTPSG